MERARASSRVDANALTHDVRIRAQDKPHAGITRCAVLGRGYNYATAYEWALKLKELTYIEAEAHSSADFSTGRIAMVDGTFPVMAVVPEGAVYASTMECFREYPPILW